MSETWLLRDLSNGNTRECDSRSEAEATKQDLASIGANIDDLEIIPPNDVDDLQDQVDDDTEIVDMTENEPTTTSGPDSNTDELPDTPPMDEDPLTWIPSDFVVEIEGQPAITKKGYDVLAHHYNISVTTECRVSPNESDYTYAEVKATAVTDDGVEYTAHGSAHVDRGDDHGLLLEMADTRAAKRATARATGVGMVAVSELQNNL